MQILPGIHFPEIIDLGDKLINSSYTLPDEALSDVLPELKQVVSPPVRKKKSVKKSGSVAKGFSR